MRHLIAILRGVEPAEAADMARGIMAGDAHRCSLDLALHAVDAMTSILRAGEIGAFVELSTTCERPEPLSPDQAQALLR